MQIGGFLGLMTTLGRHCVREPHRRIGMVRSFEEGGVRQHPDSSSRVSMKLVTCGLVQKDVGRRMRQPRHRRHGEEVLNEMER